MIDDAIVSLYVAAIELAWSDINKFKSIRDGSKMWWPLRTYYHYERLARDAAAWISELRGDGTTCDALLFREH